MNVQNGFDLSKTTPITFSPDGKCNTTDEVLLDQIAHNIRLGVPQLVPHARNDKTALLVCGGPSLAETEKELVEEYWAGNRIVAVNGAYQWCLDRNLKPSAAIMLDAREFNARFFETPAPGCKYLLASQCHPAAFEMCRGRETLIWHAIGTGSDEEIALLDDYYFGRNYAAITLGTTIGIRAISMLALLGFYSIDIFGLDSCWHDDRHHGYSQVENDRDGRIPVWLRPKDRDDKARRFICAPWHVKQADDFMTFVKERGGSVQLSVRGAGLIATILRTGAEMETETKE